MLLRYDIPSPSAVYGHWGSVGHEIQVYRDLLRLLPTRVPRYCGTFTVEATGQRCLILEWLDNTLRLDSAVDTEAAMTLTAQWVGRFHAAAEARIREAPIPFLNIYNGEYYVRWARQVTQDGGTLHERYPWLSTLCDHFEEASLELVKGAFHFRGFKGRGSGRGGKGQISAHCDIIDRASGKPEGKDRFGQ